MDNLKIDLCLDGGFSFCGSNSSGDQGSRVNSFSSMSSAASSFGPFTPTSGRSTPRIITTTAAGGCAGLDFDPGAVMVHTPSSYVEQSFPFQLTPPSAGGMVAGGCYFPQGAAAVVRDAETAGGSTTDDFMAVTMPTTPRYGGALSPFATMSGPAGSPFQQLSSGGAADTFPFAAEDGLAPSPLFMPTPLQSVHKQHQQQQHISMADITQVWGFPPSCESPIGFDREESPVYLSPFRSNRSMLLRQQAHQQQQQQKQQQQHQHQQQQQQHQHTLEHDMIDKMLAAPPLSPRFISSSPSQAAAAAAAEVGLVVRKRGATSCGGASVRQKSTALQRATSIRKRAKAREVSAAAVAACPDDVTRKPSLPMMDGTSGQNLCPYPGCGRRFKRGEHLKRHVLTDKIHNPGVEAKNLCPFCKTPFTRFDNYKAHVKLHDNTSRKAARVQYHPKAAAYLEEIQRKSRPRKSAVAKTEAEPTTIKPQASIREVEEHQAVEAEDR